MKPATQRAFTRRRGPARFQTSRGLDAPYEAPASPEVHLETADLSIDEAAAQVISHLEEKKILGKS